MINPVDRTLYAFFCDSVRTPLLWYIITKTLNAPAKAMAKAQGSKSLNVLLPLVPWGLELAGPAPEGPGCLVAVAAINSGILPAQPGSQFSRDGGHLLRILRDEEPSYMPLIILPLRAPAL